MDLMCHMILSCIFVLHCIPNYQGKCSAYSVMDDSGLDQLDDSTLDESYESELDELDILSRDLQEASESKVISSDTTEDSEGLSPLRQKAAMHDMTPDGEKRNDINFPKPLDENSKEERVQEKQRLKKLQDATITEQKPKSDMLRRNLQEAAEPMAKINFPEPLNENSKEERVQEKQLLNKWQDATITEEKHKSDMLRRDLQEATEPKLISSDTTVDSEGLTPLRQKAAMHDMTPDGEKRKEVNLPEPLDENPDEEQILEKQRLKSRKDAVVTEEKRDAGISDDELHQLILKAVCPGNDALEKSATCQMVEKRQYRRMLSREKRKYSAKKLQWEKGIVLYAFDKELEETEAGKKAIIRAMKYIESVSCVQFFEYTPGVHKKLGLNRTSYLNFINKGGRRCYSLVGRTGKTKQDIAACGKFFVASHELLHALGSEHEQSRADRGKWIQILVGNVKPANIHNFLRVADTRLFGTKYDYGSVMHYSAYGFSKNGYPTIAVYDRDLRFLIGRRGLLSHEDIMALNGAYKCKARKCPTFTDVCQNHGFVGYKDKKCQCICPDGLMGKTCEKIFKPSDFPSEWPSGTYGIPQPANGCPVGSWDTGSRYQTTNCCYIPRKEYHIKKGTWSEKHINHQFCMRGSAGNNPVNWMPGKYCIYKKGKCPKGFEVGSIRFDIIQNTEKNNVEGVVPDGVYGNDTKFYYCCRDDGEVEIPIRLPISKPFYLFMSENASTCQAVEGARFYKEYVDFPRGDNSTRAASGHYPNLNNIVRTILKRYQLDYCYYDQMSYACGGIITLTDDSKIQNIKTPNYPSNYNNSMECYWLIKSPADTQIQVSMEDFDLEDGRMNTCPDSLEIRHHSIAQPGSRYCGSYFTRSFTSNYNSMMLIFRSSVDVVRKGFNAKVSLVKNSRYNCYDIHNMGKTYAGKVNYTRDYRPCISWSAAERCPLNLWNLNYFLNEDHNYCRNPSGAEQPWCYINATTCELDLCDVCGINVCYDRIEECANKIEQDTEFCSSEEGFTKCHKTCGKCGKAMSEKVRSCSRPPAPQKASFVPETLKTSYNIGDTVKYNCDTGFGVHSRVCLSDGSWSGSTKMCAVCPSKWKPEGQSCFWGSKEKATWENAEAACQQMGAQLASPSNLQQQRVMESLLNYRSFWIGYNDKTTEGKFEWSDGSQQNFTLWEPAYPSKRNTWANCVLVSPIKTRGENYRGWYEFKCSAEKNYACEGIIATCEDIMDCQALLNKHPTMCTKYNSYAASKCRLTCGFCGPNMTTTTSPPTTLPPTTISFPSSTCLSGWIGHGSNCYKLFEEKKTAWDAYQDCINRGTQLVIIQDKEKDDFIRQWLRNEKAKNTWMALTDEKQEGKWIWNSTGEIAKYTGWYHGQPNNFKNKQHCAWFYHRRDYQWGDDVCNATAYFICQTTQPRVTSSPTPPVVDFCKTSWTKHASSCYKIFVNVLEDWGDFDNALSSCKRNGAYLVKISDEAESNFLQKQLNKTKAYTVWIGLADRQKQGEFRWTKDDSVVTYADWAPYQPSNTVNQDCVAVHKSYEYRWNDNPCNRRFGFVCEYDLHVPITTPAALTVTSHTTQSTSARTLPPTGCSSDWTNYDGSCYMLLAEKKKAVDSNQDCLKLGAYLVVIDNKEEDDFLRQWLDRKISLDAWIGLTDEKEENKWVWKSTGKVPIYTGWRPGRPSTKYNDYKDCAVMEFTQKYSWSDTFCNFKAYSICESPAVTPTTEVPTTELNTEMPITTTSTTTSLPTSATTIERTTSALTGVPAVTNTVLIGHTAKLRTHKDSWRHTSRIPEPYTQITCSGFVVGWEVYFAQHEPVFLQIWRPQGQKKYQLVEETYVAAHIGLTAINLDPSEQIPVQKGDVMGFYFGITNPIPFDGKKCSKGHMIYNRKNTRYTFAGDVATFENKKASWEPCREYSVQAVIQKDTKSCTTRREISTSRKKASALRRLLKEKFRFRF